MITLKVRERNERGTEFYAFAEIQGRRVEFTGTFQHWEESPRVSSWEINNWVKINGNEAPADELYALLSTPEIDGLEVLNEMLVAQLDSDWSAWMAAPKDDIEVSKIDYPNGDRRLA